MPSEASNAPLHRELDPQCETRQTDMPAPTSGYVEVTDQPDSRPSRENREKAPPVQDNRVVIDAMDPQGCQQLSARASDELRHIEQEKRAEDPEKGQYLTHDPFDKDGRFDFGTFLKHIYSETADRDCPHHSMGVAFRDLHVTGYGTGAKAGMTFGSVMTAPLRLPQFLGALIRPQVKHILKGIDGCAKPGEMVLVLGRPGAGCTTLLKTLASYRDGFRSIDGTVLYEGLDHRVIDGPLRGEVVYAPEDDKHFPTLTVAQTLAFAVAARTPRSNFRDFFDKQHSRPQYVSLIREMLATVLGLRHTYNTKVGGDLVRWRLGW